MVNERIEELVLSICREQGFELYDIEFKNTDKGRVLRISITSATGITLDECAIVSRKLSNELDVMDFISSQYFLEVSSPGIERNLTKEAHYRGAIGETVKITYRNDNNKTDTKTGMLKDVLPTGLLIEIEETGESTAQEFPYKTLKKIRTVFVFNKKVRK